MTTVSGLCTAALFAFAASGLAQQPGSTGPARNDGVTTPNDFEQSASAKGAQTLNLTGCLDRANDGTYQLRDARPSSSADATRPSGNTGSAATGTSGTAGTSGRTAGDAATGGTAASDAERNTWILKSTTDLAPHVGHSVEITGRMSSPDNAGGTNEATTSNPTTTATGARIKKPGEETRSVDVQSVRMISRSCS
jgi:hypothetical protein